MKSWLMVMLCMLVIVFCQNFFDGREDYNETLKLNKASLFLNYTAAFDAYYLSNGGANGDVTNFVLLPSWLPVDSSIRMYISSGAGYIFMPSASGVLSEIMKRTDYSAWVGFSDDTSIITLSGKLNKPSFIPANYIVYVR
ncbi:type IV pilus biogenesis protein PilM [Xenorhabdus budapestensis]|uniref:Type IV pilus biogenesis protein PilM n=1 Tax=Xenorhabdus budapestensis TaxID=290110 RepID=A0A2D0ITA8_XENBU|nr:type IV pilus biogenesis protein PilM [Xenorhabdus budapestensis]PHM25090.1 type IV pilus biogenesis protein PilM [Xenorhabdus budapestensis]